MNTTPTIPKRLLFNASMLVFVIQANQVGVGVLGFHRLIAKYVRQDAWIAIVIAGLAVHLILWVMVATLRMFDSSDLYGIHDAVWGKWLGRVLNALYTAMLAAPTLVIIETYIEVIQTWISVDIPSWFVSLSLLLLVIYGVLGGLRIIVGFCLLSVLSTIWLVLLAYYPLQYAVWSHLLPVFEAKLPDLLTAVQKMALTLSGFEIIYFVYPFVRDKHHAYRYSQIAALITNLIYLIAMLTATVYFSQEQLLHNIWAQLSILKIIQLPFLERFEYLIIPLWVLVILPNMLLYTWATTRGLKHVFHLSQKKGVYAVALITLGLGFLFNTRQKVNQLNDLFNTFYLYAVFLYPLLLYVVALIKTKWQRRQEGKQT
ncbi:GerAB/ArcD/ProY family transporter [Tumebacillus permanentifrigoris]|uniref:Spore germination protein (Amino acid permease) n=1 Tax=Tumebacillus permanentifrigoris TaxID=378543 RepID=A0A316D4Y2_9BACL|nr:GerAB/ArcD/ProY family transporter [Tumebacillus permanentifrigoris]PWK07862.1 spore germination protein (amino acid permease) [Tumebacillus permanentifrigoris]